MKINDLAQRIPLDGTWEFSLGLEEYWQSIQVPECWESQGFNMFVEGPALYRRTVFLPAEWARKRILLEFGAVSYACTLWMNGIEVGRHFGLWTPFTLDVTMAARPGENNQVTLEVWKPGKRYPMRSSLAGFLPDVATTFGGIWQTACVRAEDGSLDDVIVRVDDGRTSLLVHARAEVFGDVTNQLLWQVEVRQGENIVAAHSQAWSPEGVFDAVIPLMKVAAWTPHNPALYTVIIHLFSGSQVLARVAQQTGFRRLSADGAQLLFNGRPFMVRGILSWGWEPDRIAPTYTREQAVAEIRRVREMGFNLIKLCLVVPNQAYFDAADEEGMLLWIELPMWLPEVTPALRQQAPLEYSEIAKMLARHPSIVLYSLGCELNRSVDGALMGKLNEAVRDAVDGALLCDNSGSGESYGGLDFDLADFTDYHPYYDIHYFEPLLDNWRRDWQPARPWIFGEFCDSDTFRNIAAITEANGGKRPWWLTTENPVTTWRSEAQAVLEWEERLAAAQPGFSLQEIVQISYQQSLVIRKYTLEALRRRSGIGGYIITGLRDTPISTSGVWDDFGQPKWSAQEMGEINNDAVLALDVVRRRQWRHGGDRPSRVDPYNYWSGDTARWYIILTDSGSGFVKGSRFRWSLREADGSIVASSEGVIEQAAVPGVPVQVGSISAALPVVGRAVQLRLEASITDGEREVHNHWSVWVYPRHDWLPAGAARYDPTGMLADFGPWTRNLPEIPSGTIQHVPVVIATTLTRQVWSYLEEGGRVLLLQQGENPLPVLHCPFWREAIKLFPQHPLWQKFPQQGFTDLQFFGIASDLAFDTAHLAAALPVGASIRPILRRLDAREFQISEYLFEAQVGQGVLIGCTLRLQGGAGAQPTGWERNTAGGAMLQALTRLLVR